MTDDSLRPDRPLVSVVVGTFNGAKFLSQQLTSLAVQTLPPAELVVSDDGSTDGTAEIVADFGRTAPFPVRFHCNETRLGFRANFMHAAELGQSDLIAFCDQDDVWHPDKLEIVAAAFSAPEVLLAYHKVDLIDADGHRLGELEERSPGRALSPPLTISPWVYGLGFTQVFRRTLLRASHHWAASVCEHDPKDPMSHDQWVAFLGSALGTIAYIDRPLASYRQHGANAFGWVPPVAQSRLARILENRSPEFRRCAAAAAGRAGILDAIAEESSEPWRTRAREGARRFRRLHDLFSERDLLYAARRPAQRWGALGRMRKLRAYDDDKPWSFGRPALLKDLGVGLLLGSVRQRGGPA